MTDQYLQFQSACEWYVENTSRHPDVMGIVVSGSFIHGELNMHSDIDIFVILDENCDYRERGNTWINNVEIEYFKNSPQQIRAYFKKEQSPHTAHMLAFGKVVYQASDMVATLVAEAKTIINNQPAALKPFQIELGKYHLDDLEKDLRDARLTGNELAGGLLRYQLLNLSIDLFCQKHRIWRTKHKGLFQQLNEIDPNFASTIKKFNEAGWLDMEEMQNLQNYMADLLGGARSREWQLRSPLDLELV